MIVLAIPIVPIRATEDNAIYSEGDRRFNLYQQCHSLFTGFTHLLSLDIAIHSPSWRLLTWVMHLRHTVIDSISKQNKEGAI